ncbi:MULTISPECIES: hypothetical protein [unclassified Solwaraspora]|uniref:hypothetical protein n=1 Tax=unclassified Solwaraspora TaxID=2627926 RepID=UPI00248D2573|nr:MULTISPECIES: hypothetical protein [unclassified Solwaraspora]WBB97967.1 hypothetical protein O7553_03125 [Solwaraspora sp. WMMA2059]WBC23474.1 hypothetical protein O7543_14230 [Solwaraspora sp. WMMA2080]WJK34440.1 hypothetical protein O7610_28220 [Solwaraspora sp. WMMA2065]
MMTRSELIRVRRQMHRRIRVVVAERRVAGGRALPAEPVDDTVEQEPALLR